MWLHTCAVAIWQIMFTIHTMHASSPMNEKGEDSASGSETAERSRKTSCSKTAYDCTSSPMAAAEVSASDSIIAKHSKHSDSDSEITERSRNTSSSATAGARANSPMRSHGASDNSTASHNKEATDLAAPCAAENMDASIMLHCTRMLE